MWDLAVVHRCRCQFLSSPLSLCKHIDFYWFPPSYAPVEVGTAKHVMRHNGSFHWRLMKIHIWTSSPLQGQLCYKILFFKKGTSWKFGSLGQNSQLANATLLTCIPSCGAWLLASHCISTAPSNVLPASFQRSHHKTVIKEHKWEWAESGLLPGKLIYLYSVSAGLNTRCFSSRSHFTPSLPPSDKHSLFFLHLSVTSNCEKGGSG